MNLSTTTEFSSQCLQQSVGPGNAMISALLQTLLVAQCAISPPEMWPKDYGTIGLAQGLDTYDFVVIGAGSAGSVVASRLSENPNWKVLVLEAGGDPPIETEIPAVFFAVQHTEFNWNYFTEPDGKTCLAYKNQVCYWPRGKMIGGTGAINAMLYVRGIREDYDNWERMGNPTWAWKDVLPVFDKSLENSESETIGAASINPFEVHYSEIRDMIYSGAQELGLSKLESIFNGAEVGYTTLLGTIKNGRRGTTGKSFLAKVKNRPNLHVIKNAVVTKIDLSETGNQVTGVTFTYKDQHKMSVKVGKEVVLSAGALDSPKVLMLSGIGPKKHLESLGIPVVKDLRVGDNLQDHVIVPLVFKIGENKVKQFSMRDLLDVTYSWLVNQTGLMASHGTVAVTGFINSDETSNSPDADIMFHHLLMQRGTSNLEIWLQALGLSDSVAQSIRKIQERDHIFLVYIVLLRPKSIGKMRLRSADPKEPAKLFANYFAHSDDMDTIVRGIKFQMKIEQTTAFKEQNAEIVQIDLPECDKFTFKSDDYWKCYTRHMCNTLYHQSCTVKMGPDTDKAAVLDSQLRVKGVQGLRVADASIMPAIVSLNTNAPTIMIAEKAAEFIRQDWPGSGHTEL